MVTVFWDSQGVIYIDYLEKGKTITGLYYAELLDRFNAELQKKRTQLSEEVLIGPSSYYQQSSSGPPKNVGW